MTPDTPIFGVEHADTIDTEYRAVPTATGWLVEYREVVTEVWIPGATAAPCSDDDFGDPLQGAWCPVHMPGPWLPTTCTAITERSAVLATLDHSPAIYPLTELAEGCACQIDAEDEAASAATYQWAEAVYAAHA